MADVYVYGMTVLSTIHQMRERFPVVNTYGEIQRSIMMPGGEAANAAIVLRNLGLTVDLDGCYLGSGTAGPLLEYFQKRGVGCACLKQLDDFDGWRDIVFCDGESRTVFGWFGAFLFGSRKLWSAPEEDSIRQARCAAIDPFFGAESDMAAELCCRYRVPYVTIDCAWDTPIAQNSRAVVVSQEFIEREYPQMPTAKLFEQYHNACRGLVIFTFGSRDILYQSPDEDNPTHFTPFRVHVVDTLAAGDTFRAGIVYGVTQAMPASEMVRFAAATAAVSCTRFPSVYEPPEMAEIRALLQSPN